MVLSDWSAHYIGRRQAEFEAHDYKRRRALADEAMRTCLHCKRIDTPAGIEAGEWRCPHCTLWNKDRA